MSAITTPSAGGTEPGATIDITKDAVVTALRAFILFALPTGVQVVEGQQNNVPLPNGRVVVMTPLMQTAMNVPTTHYSANTVGKRSSVDWRVQLDVYGDNAEDAATMLATLLRSSVAFDWLADNGYAIRPLYASDPQNMAFINDAMNYESRWMLEAHLNASPTISVPQQFAEHLSVGVVAADVRYLP